MAAAPTGGREDGYERHVGLRTAEIPLNAYSLYLGEDGDWLSSMADTQLIVGQPK